MSHNPKRRKVPAILASAIGVGAFGMVSTAGAQEQSQQELLNEVRLLQSKVSQLEAQQGQAGRDTVDSVDALIKDADRRSTLMNAGSFTAGYNAGKFLIQDESGDNSLNPFFQLQIRGVWNYREEDASDSINGDATNESGLEIRRMRFGVQGNVFGQNTKYRFMWDTDRNGGDLTLLDAYVTHQFADQWAVKAGQFKDPTYHEENTSSTRQLAVDRSLVNEVFGGGVTDRIQGVGLIWDDGDGGLPIRAEFGYSDGINSDNTNFVDGGGNSLFGVAAPDYGLYGRVEWVVTGDDEDYEDFTAMGTDETLFVVGGGVSYTQSGDSSAIFHTVDAQFETAGGLSVYAAYLGTYADPSDLGFDFDDDGEDASSTYDWGVLVQAGYMLGDKWEVFGRYSYTGFDDERFVTDFDDDASGPEDEFHELTAGVNYYMQGHRAKFTADLTYLPDGTPTDQNQIGILDPDADTDQVVGRVQFQLLI